MFAGLELSIAAFAHSDYRGWGFFDDPQASVRHEPSLAHLTQEWPRPVEIKRHHYPSSCTLGERPERLYNGSRFALEKGD